MNSNNLILILFLIFSTIAQTKELNYLYVNNPRAVECENIYDADTCISLSIGKIIIPTELQNKTKAWKKDGWFHINTDIMTEDTWSIQTKYLLADEEFVKVVSNWRVKSFKYDFGDSRHIITFSRDGKAYIKHGTKKITGHVYIDPSATPYLIQIRYIDPQIGKISDTYRFDPVKKAIDTKNVCGIVGDLCEQIFYD